MSDLEVLADEAERVYLTLQDLALHACVSPYAFAERMAENWPLWAPEFQARLEQPIADEAWAGALALIAADRVVTAEAGAHGSVPAPSAPGILASMIVCAGFWLGVALGVKWAVGR